jgi:hypothetical protein
VSEFGQIGKQRGADYWADARHTPQHVLLLTPQRAADRLAEFSVDTLQSFAQPGDVLLDIATDGGGAVFRRFSSAVSISTNCRRRVTRALSAWVAASGSGRTAGRTASAKWACT